MYREFNIQEKVLMFLNSIGAIEPGKARNPHELAIVINEDVSKVIETLENLLQNGYVGKAGNNYFLTEKGIIRLMRSFS
ncbi:MAG TPA: hypothetical protein VKU94_05640 [Geobacterales bacterium]|nr:hypothetical protein [Geobacterales bacterium]